MRTGSGIADAQTQSMLDRLEREREKFRRETDEQTAAQCMKLAADARRRARQRVAQAVAETREHNDARLGLIRAALQTRLRQRQHQRQLRLLETGRETLAESLRERWQHAEERHAWCQALIRRAGALLHQKEWLLVNAEGLAENERSRLVEAAAKFGAVLSFECDESIAGGARLTAGAACIDASAANLCRPSPELDAALLAALVEIEEAQ
jgi:vacuolar-type H+-ATPase subunit E/Vma4